jgi:hypothetical protein
LVLKKRELRMPFNKGDGSSMNPEMVRMPPAQLLKKKPPSPARFLFQ